MAALRAIASVQLRGLPRPGSKRPAPRPDRSRYASRQPVLTLGEHLLCAAANDRLIGAPKHIYAFAKEPVSKLLVHECEGECVSFCDQDQRRREIRVAPCACRASLGHAQHRSARI